MSYNDALDALARSGKTHPDLLDAIGAGEIEVRCQRTAEFAFLDYHYYLIEFESGDLIYIDAQRIELESGVVEIDEVLRFPHGFHRCNRTPYWHIHRRDDSFTLYLCSKYGTYNHEPRVLSRNFMENAEILPDGSALLDDITILQRRIAYDVTVDAGAFSHCFSVDINSQPAKRLKVGKPPSYNNRVCNLKFFDWFKKNPQADRYRQIVRLREIYEDSGLKVGSDKKYRVEAARIKRIKVGQFDNF